RLHMPGFTGTTAAKGGPNFDGPPFTSARGKAFEKPFFPSAPFGERVRSCPDINMDGPAPIQSLPESACSRAEPRVARLSDLSRTQWKSGIAAWLGWLFDGLDMHLYVLVAAPFVAQLLHVTETTDPLVARYSSWIQAAFLVGWALGGGFF